MNMTHTFQCVSCCLIVVTDGFNHASGAGYLLVVAVNCTLRSSATIRSIITAWLALSTRTSIHTALAQTGQVIKVIKICHDVIPPVKSEMICFPKLLNTIFYALVVKI